jgi:hypothetical protein
MNKLKKENLFVSRFNNLRLKKIYTPVSPNPTFACNNLSFFFQRAKRLQRDISLEKSGISTFETRERKKKKRNIYIKPRLGRKRRFETKICDRKKKQILLMLSKLLLIDEFLGVRIIVKVIVEYFFSLMFDAP